MKNQTTSRAPVTNPDTSGPDAPPRTVGQLPLHIQISEMLVREIQAGLLTHDERLPPERQLAERLQISVGTLRKALSDLESKGMLLRKHGSGNYVQNNVAADNVYALFRLELTRGGGLPTAQVLSVRKMKKPGSLPDFGSSSYAHRIRRLRKLNEHNAAVEEIWLDASYADSIDAKSLPESLYMYYKDALGFWITRVEDRVSVSPLPAWAPDDAFNTAISHYGYVERLSRDNQGDLAEFSRTWFDPNTTRFVAR